MLREMLLKNLSTGLPFTLRQAQGERLPCSGIPEFRTPDKMTWHYRIPDPHPFPLRCEKPGQIYLTPNSTKIEEPLKISAGAA